MSLSQTILKQALCVGLILCSLQALAGAREQALRIHSRVAGVPPSEAVLLEMTDLIADGDVAGAVRLAMENDGFYRATLKTMVTPWTNRDQTPFAPLNDYTATVMGLVRDERDFRTLLYDDVLYTGADNLGLPPYSTHNNDHYEALEMADVRLVDALTRKTQSALTGLPSEATAG